MTALLEERRVPATIGTRGVQRMTTVLFVAAVLLAAYTGFRLPGDWAVTLESVSLTDGFHRRFLIGTLLRPFALVFGYDYWVYAIAGFLVLGLLLAVLTVVFFRARTISKQFLVIGWLLMPTGGFLFHEVGYFDQVLYLLLFGALCALNRGRLVLAGGLMVASVLTHEIALLTVIPVFGFALLRKLPFRKACAVLLPSAGTGLVLLALPAAAPGAVQRFQQVLADARFPFRDDAIGLFNRSQAESWGVYSITDVLLYLLPIVVVVVAGFLLLHRPSLSALLSLAAILTPALLAFGGWDEARWGFLLITGFVMVLWIQLGDRELGLPRFGALAAILLILAQLPMPYFDGFQPREVTLVGTPHAVGAFR
ncbi:hypothetical protein ATK36_3092 [Amycolatopsis sulphurea]|uniref:Uncharacterized protein n=1 Tax=Amycolatopsis sulphurea TaxID=76022 RepID=A0A2A9FBZ7_9PSEU|nr:hypothetical protein [Amycolatopsis sulphurea]PFG48020.1 hypothetical protein ATK36_3092 [Amycolatopsis sulphurea]